MCFFVQTILYASRLVLQTSFLCMLQGSCVWKHLQIDKYQKIHQIIAHYNLPTLKVSNQKYARLFIYWGSQHRSGVSSYGWLAEFLQETSTESINTKCLMLRKNISALRGHCRSDILQLFFKFDYSVGCFLEIIFIERLLDSEGTGWRSNWNFHFHFKVNYVNFPIIFLNTPSN